MQRPPHQGPTPASHGSRTLTVTDAPPSPSSSSADPHASGSGLPTLRLRGRPDPGTRGVTWSDTTIDNEGLGRKKSKICCIYHKPKPFDQSSDESSSDSDPDSDGSADSRDEGRARPTARARRPPRNHHHHHHHHHHHDGDCDHAPGDSPASFPSGTTTAIEPQPAGENGTLGEEGPIRPRPPPNAYERAPAVGGLTRGFKGKGKAAAT